MDDFCKDFFVRFGYGSLKEGFPFGQRGPSRQMVPSEIMTLMLLYQELKMKNLKAFYAFCVESGLKIAFPGLVSYERFVYLQSSMLGLLTVFLMRRFGEKTGLYYIDSTALPVCHNLRISRNKVFQGIAQRGKTSTGWFFGFKAHF